MTSTLCERFNIALNIANKNAKHHLQHAQLSEKISDVRKSASANMITRSNTTAAQHSITLHIIIDRTPPTVVFQGKRIIQPLNLLSLNTLDETEFFLFYSYARSLRKSRRKKRSM